MIIPFLTATQLTTCHNFLQCGAEITSAAIDLSSLGQQLNDNDNSIAEKHLAPNELEKFHTFRYPKRRIEWLGGRIAAKVAFSKMTSKSLAWHDMVITPDSVGRPYISSNLSPAPDISISHSGNLAVAIVSRNKSCGIDIQDFTPTIIKVRERFALAGESSLIKQQSKLSAQKSLTLLWTAKEALRKAFAYKKLLGFKEIELLSIEGAADLGFQATFKISRHPGHKAQNVFLALLPDYACGITLNSHSEN